jgi:hypothetical protein
VGLLCPLGTALLIHSVRKKTNSIAKTQSAPRKDKILPFASLQENYFLTRMKNFHKTDQNSEIAI